jgi:hypothetical protein
MGYRPKCKKIGALLLCVLFILNSNLAFAHTKTVSEPISYNAECVHDAKSHDNTEYGVQNIKLCCYSVTFMFEFEDFEEEEIVFDKQIAFKPVIYHYFDILEIYHPPKQYS